jgi:enoyl-[acyl-carrier protein] reductase II
MTDAQAQLAELWHRGCDLLGSRYAILGGAMTWLSERNLVSALSNAGGFGVIACGAMTPDLLDQEIAATFELTDQPFGVNLITMHPNLGDLIDVCIVRGVSHVVLAGGLPRDTDIGRLKDAATKVIAFAPALPVARRLVRSGADGIIIEGAEAGGHIGPVSTGVLAQEILPNITEVPVFVAGGIGRGDAMALYLRMGASGCQLGTRFVCASECIAHPNFKRAFIRANARDASLSVQVDPQFSVIPVRALVNEGTRRFDEFQREIITRFHAGEVEQKEAQLDIEHFWAGALRRAAIDGDVKFGSLMAGQSVGMVNTEEPIAKIIDELIEQAGNALSPA